MDSLRQRRQGAKWRDNFAHNSTRTCGRCKHFRAAHRFCERHQFLTLKGATCRFVMIKKEGKT